MKCKCLRMYVRYPGYNRLSIPNKRTRPQKSRACCLIRVLYFPFFSTSESPAGEFVTLWFLLFFRRDPFSPFYCLVWTFGRYLLEVEVVPLIKLYVFIPGLEVSRSRGGDNSICGFFSTNRFGLRCRLGKGLYEFRKWCITIWSHFNALLWLLLHY